MVQKKQHVSLYRVRISLHGYTRTDLKWACIGSIVWLAAHVTNIHNWASEASPTLGCSIEISRDIYMYILYVYMSVCLVCQINCVGGIT